MLAPPSRSRGPAAGRSEAQGTLAGLVLCGGASRRMGADKALVELAGTPLIEYPLAALRGLGVEPWLACGETPRYAELGCELVLDAWPDGGPLAGLVAGLEAAAARGVSWVCVLACDMPRVETRVLAALLERARERDLDACLLGLERGSQPTYAVYHARCAASARRALESGQRRLVSFHALPVEERPARIEVLPADGIAAAGDAPGSALNLNTRDELARERAARGEEGS